MLEEYNEWVEIGYQKGYPGMEIQVEWKGRGKSRNQWLDDVEEEDLRGWVLVRELSKGGRSKGLKGCNKEDQAVQPGSLS